VNDVTIVSKSNCVFVDQHYFCYKPKVGDAVDPLYSAYAALHDVDLIRTKFLRSSLNGLLWSRSSCFFSAVRKFQLVSGTLRIPLYLIHPDACNSFGNSFGYFIEALGYGMHHGIAVGMIDHGNVNCTDPSRDGSHLFKYLPRLLIPKHYFRGSKPVGNVSSAFHYCASILQYPWESPSAYMWRFIEIISKINSMMVMRFSAEHGGEVNHNDHTISIHFRCGDNLFHPSMGMLPFPYYKYILTKIYNESSGSIRRVVIYTDAGVSRPHWEICSTVLDALRKEIISMNGFQLLGISVEVSALARAYVSMHNSRYLLCSQSTFCLFAALGSAEVYLPRSRNATIGCPRITTRNSSYFFSNVELLRPNCLNDVSGFITRLSRNK
jgi:hypothetical protein